MVASAPKSALSAQHLIPLKGATYQAHARQRSYGESCAGKVEVGFLALEL